MNAECVMNTRKREIRSGGGGHLVEGVGDLGEDGGIGAVAGKDMVRVEGVGGRGWGPVGFEAGDQDGGAVRSEAAVLGVFLAATPDAPIIKEGDSSRVEPGEVCSLLKRIELWVAVLAMKLAQNI